MPKTPRVHIGPEKLQTAVIGCLMTLIAAACIVGLVLRYVWLPPDPRARISPAIVALVMIFGGVSLFLAVALDPLIVLELRPLKRPRWEPIKRIEDQSGVTRGERIFWLVVGMIVALLGVVSFLGALFSGG